MSTVYSVRIKCSGCGSVIKKQEKNKAKEITNKKYIYG